MPDAAEACAFQNATYFKKRCLNSTQMTAMGLVIDNVTSAIRKPPAEEYFKYKKNDISIIDFFFAL